MQPMFSISNSFIHPNRRHCRLRTMLCPFFCGVICPKVYVSSVKFGFCNCSDDQHVVLTSFLYIQYDWDLAINWVSLHIDGVTNARQISKKAEVDMEMVQACLRVLRHHGVIALVDMFFFSNHYECTEKAAFMISHSPMDVGPGFITRPFGLGRHYTSSNSWI